MCLHMLYFEEIAKDEYREREPQKNDPNWARASGTRDAVICAFRQQVYLANSNSAKDYMLSTGFCVGVMQNE